MNVLLWLGVAAAFYVLVEIIVFSVKARGARQSFTLAEPFERHVKSSNYRTLFLGDSTAVGIGASKPELSVAGRFASQFPKMDITNRGVSGFKLEDLEGIVPKQPKYDLVILQIGANDILRFTPLNKAEKHLSRIFKQTKAISNQIIILHGGNIGAGPLFLPPLKLIYDKRTRKFRRLYMKKSKEFGAAYADIYKPLGNALAYERQHSTYGNDSFHPGDLGYQLWFERILAAIYSSGYDLPE